MFGFYRALYYRGVYDKVIGRSAISSIHWNGSDWIDSNTNGIQTNIRWCSGNPQGTTLFYIEAGGILWKVSRFLPEKSTFPKSTM